MTNDQISIDDALKIAIAHYEAGRITDAEQIYHAILEINPNHSGATYHLGILATDIGCDEEGLTLLQRAIALDPHVEQYHLGYINLLSKKGDIQKVFLAVEEAKTKLLPENDSVELSESTQTTGKYLKKKKKTKVLNPSAEEIEIASQLFTAGNFAETLSYAKILVQKYPNSGDALNILGVAYRYVGEWDLSIEILKKALKILPTDPEINYNLGVAYQQDKFEFEQAIVYFLKAIQLNPKQINAYNNLGNIYLDLKEYDEAKKIYQKILNLQPNYMKGYSNLGLIYKHEGNLEKTIECYLKALELDPNIPDVYNNLGNALLDQGDFDNALNNYYKAIELNPQFDNAYANYLFALNYHPDKSAEEIYDIYKQYEQSAIFKNIPVPTLHTNSKETNRILKIGYVSPDFKKHPVQYFLEPLLANHDKTAVEIYAYAEMTVEDEVTQDYKTFVDHWTPTLGMSDEDLAERIKKDNIDILIDVAGHTAGNRLRVFARKPAPVSISWLGFGYTTGLSTIDYYLCDEMSVPMGSEHLFSEEPWRLDRASYVYRPPIEAMGAVNKLPAIQNKYITFGTLTRSVRVNHKTIRIWAEVLKRIPNSKLVIDSKNYTDPVMKHSLIEQFKQHGISEERLLIGFNSPPWDLLRNIDIGLDCFPHNSGTTLFEMLFMGIPYVTLADRPSVGRIGSSILNGLKRNEWIAYNEEQYIEKLVVLADNITKLASIRENLREEMLNSDLMDEKGFAKTVEHAYRKMFLKWSKGSQ